jgi:hypothetical protein
LQMSENKRPLELTYIIRAIKEGKLNEWLYNSSRLWFNSLLHRWR